MIRNYIISTLIFLAGNAVVFLCAYLYDTLPSTDIAMRTILSQSATRAWCRQCVYMYL